MPDSENTRPIREVLRELGERRKRQMVDKVDLALDIRAALERAVSEKVPVTQACELLSIDRSTVYRVYIRETRP